MSNPVPLLSVFPDLVLEGGSKEACFVPPTDACGRGRSIAAGRVIAMLRDMEQPPVSGGEAACVKRDIRQFCRSWLSESTVEAEGVVFMARVFGFVFDGLISGKDTTRNETTKLFFRSLPARRRKC